jgi:hypothetical protein
MEIFVSQERGDGYTSRAFWILHVPCMPMGKHADTLKAGKIFSSKEKEEQTFRWGTCGERRVLRAVSVRTAALRSTLPQASFQVVPPRSVHGRLGGLSRTGGSH